MIEKEITTEINGITYTGTQIIDGDYHLIQYKQWSKQDLATYTSDTICTRDGVAKLILGELVQEHEMKE